MFHLDANVVMTILLVSYFGGIIIHTCFKKELGALKNKHIDLCLRRTPTAMILIFMAFCLFWGLNVAVFITIVVAMHCALAYFLKKMSALQKKTLDKIDNRNKDETKTEP